ncbi:hypothetical protein Cch01nite_36890 [Cellulomonas chitinilytica]|uniref:Uncharacterized protein n=1 Tax=Cellulomonas chitinilytica TaxID=398759 RepID=A0A919P655_9CELL|nr:hypothetical protein [Cellulomonas chitinilytica]GIG22965.1 hypothetical protein Cch01nite_36890 [Cellulomonas chitinilytica]
MSGTPGAAAPDDEQGDDLEWGTVEDNLGAPMLDPRTAGLSAAEEYSRPQRGELSDVGVHVTIVEVSTDEDGSRDS